MVRQYITPLVLLFVTSITHVQTTINTNYGIYFGQEITAHYNYGDIHILTTLHGVSLAVCKKKCFHQPRCDFINYVNKHKMCYLVEHFNKNVGATDLLTSKKGSILGVKAEWQIISQNAPDTEAVLAVCGPPQNTPYADRLGNLYERRSKVFYRCTKSHDRNTIVTCLPSDQWENQGLICYPDQCYTHNDLWVNDSHCYVFLWNTSVNETDAKATCRRIEGRLPNIKNQEKQTYIEEMLNSYRLSGEFTSNDRSYQWVWIGLSDTDVEGVFKWTGESIGTAFSKWHDIEPDGGVNQNCVVLGPDYNYEWADVSCDDETFLTLCEINIFGDQNK